MRPSVRSLIGLVPVLTLLTGLTGLAGCGPPPEPPQLPRPVTTGSSATSTRPASPTTSPTVTPGPAGSATPTPGFPEAIAVPCDGQPTDAALLALLQAEGMLTSALAAQARVIVGPVCAGSWQYAVVSVPNLDPLQVVTRGAPDALRLVTAGTEVCDVEVRLQAPSGIQAAAACVG